MNEQPATPAPAADRAAPARPHVLPFVWRLFSFSCWMLALAAMLARGVGVIKRGSIWDFLPYVAALPWLVQSSIEGMRHRSGGRPFQFGLSTLLLLTVLVAVVCSAFATALPLGIFVVLICAMGLIGTFQLAMPLGRQMKPTSALQKTGIFVLVVISFVAAAVAFLAAIVVSFCIGYFVVQPIVLLFTEDQDKANFIAAVAGIIAAACGFFLPIWLLNMFDRTKRR